MAVESKYQKFVFDLEKRRFVGRFEAMYASEEAEGFDSWQQDDVTTLQKRVSLAILGDRPYPRVLDFGCGKGAFTRLLKKGGNRVVGVDLSKTAVAKAAARYPDIEFRALSAGRLSSLKGRFDLAVAMEVLSYIKDWRRTLAALARKASYLYVTLHVPENPIGFVKSFDELRAALRGQGTIVAEAVLDGRVLCALVKTRPGR